MVRGTDTGVCGRSPGGSPWLCVLVCVRERERVRVWSMEDKIVAEREEERSLVREKVRHENWRAEREWGGEREADRKEVSTRIHRDIVYIQFGCLCSLSSVKKAWILSPFLTPFPPKITQIWKPETQNQTDYGWIPTPLASPFLQSSLV